MAKDDLTISDHISIPISEVQFTFARSQGPGGQNVNKVNSKAIMRWPVTSTPALPPGVHERFLKRYQSRITREGDLVIASQRFRDQGRNVADCLARLQAMVRAVVEPPKRRRKTAPTRSSRERRLKDKRNQALKKDRRKFSRPDD